MSRGLGSLQRAILDQLNGSEWRRFSIAELAEAHGVSERRMRAAIASLDKRGLVWLTGRGMPGGHGLRPWRIEVTRPHTDAEREAGWAAIAAIGRGEPVPDP